jgi:serine/threonine protein kinase
MGIVFGVIRGRWLVIPNEGTVFEAHKLPSVYNLLYNVMDQYRILHPIGSGTFGQVFLAEDLLHHQPVALKILT